MNTDTAPFTWGYALSAACFAGGFILLAVITVAARHRIERHVQQALGHDDTLVRAFAAEVDAWDAEQTALAKRVR